MAKYQGYANYETWAVALWIYNEEGAYRHWQERAHEILADAMGNAERKAKRQEKKDACIALAEELKQEFSESDIVSRIDGTVYADLLSAALGNVDWYEVAETRFDE